MFQFSLYSCLPTEHGLDIINLISRTRKVSFQTTKISNQTVSKSLSPVSLVPPFSASFPGVFDANYFLQLYCLKKIKSSRYMPDISLRNSADDCFDVDMKELDELWWSLMTHQKLLVTS